ncbi:hypothetical protein PVAP13_9KG341956 [Panicum virgatum]|uniref:Uncharacterized protein n=1 Tax=Panicum virgatum TaxID=38727 RepID=A0A8T0NUQ1_PANVG|nr:hypothetical protein PVAP13_9KG341956 [Panicum virgatum]
MRSGETLVPVCRSHACTHARAYGAPREGHTSRRFPRSMERRSNGYPGRAGPARKRRRVNQRGRPVVVVHGEADTGGRNKQRPRHDPVGGMESRPLLVSVSSYTSLEDGNIGCRERYFSRVASVFSSSAENTELKFARLVRSFQLYMGT